MLLDTLIDNKKEIFELKSKVDNLTKENYYFTSRLDNDIKEFTNLKELNDSYAYEIERLKNEVRN